MVDMSIHTTAYTICCSPHRSHCNSAVCYVTRYELANLCVTLKPAKRFLHPLSTRNMFTMPREPRIRSDLMSILNITKALKPLTRSLLLIRHDVVFQILAARYNNTMRDPCIKASRFICTASKSHALLRVPSSKSPATNRAGRVKDELFLPHTNSLSTVLPPFVLFLVGGSL